MIELKIIGGIVLVIIIAALILVVKFFSDPDNYR